MLTTWNEFTGTKVVTGQQNRPGKVGVIQFWKREGSGETLQNLVAVLKGTYKKARDL